MYVKPGDIVAFRLQDGTPLRPIKFTKPANLEIQQSGGFIIVKINGETHRCLYKPEIVSFWPKEEQSQ